MLVLCGESKAVYVFNLPKFSRNSEVGCYPEDWLGYCKLP